MAGNVRPISGLTRRVLWFLCVVAAASIVALFILLKQQRLPFQMLIRKPPLYDSFREAERNLPHYSIYEKNTTIKYFWAAQPVYGQFFLRVCMSGSKFSFVNVRFWLGKCDAGLYYDGFACPCSWTFVSNLLFLLMPYSDCTKICVRRLRMEPRRLYLFRL